MTPPCGIGRSCTLYLVLKYQTWVPDTFALALCETQLGCHRAPRELDCQEGRSALGEMHAWKIPVGARKRLCVVGDLGRKAMPYSGLSRLR